MSEKNYSPPRAQRDGELGPEWCSLEAALTSSTIPKSVLYSCGKIQSYVKLSVRFPCIALLLEANWKLYGFVLRPGSRLRGRSHALTADDSNNMCDLLHLHLGYYIDKVFQWMVLQKN